MASKTKDKIEPMVIENPPPPKKRKSTIDDIDFIGNELANVSTRVNELELSIESLRLDIKKALHRLGL